MTSPEVSFILKSNFEIRRFLIGRQKRTNSNFVKKRRKKSFCESAGDRRKKAREKATSARGVCIHFVPPEKCSLSVNLVLPLNTVSTVNAVRMQIISLFWIQCVLYFQPVSLDDAINRRSSDPCLFRNSS